MQVVREAKLPSEPSEPRALIGFLCAQQLRISRIALEAGKAARSPAARDGEAGEAVISAVAAPAHDAGKTGSPFL